MSLKQDFIQTLGIPKTFKCKHCGRTNSLDISERHNIAECIMSNGAGIWCIVNCDICGVPQQYYPSAINGTPCTEKECDALFEELKKYEATHSPQKGGTA